jgi:hypothetical protein
MWADACRQQLQALVIVVYWRLQHAPAAHALRQSGRHGSADACRVQHQQQKRCERGRV